MSSTNDPELEARLADVQEETEQRMHSSADLLPNSEEIHDRANKLSERAEEHHQQVQRRRADEPGHTDG